MTKDEFIASYCAASGIKWEELQQFLVALPCACEASTCRGWAMVANNHRSIMLHTEINAPSGAVTGIGKDEKMSKADNEGADFGEPAPYSPLVIQRSLIGNDGWTVNFRVRPTMAVIVTGHKPSFADWVEACSNVNVSVYALWALYVAACVEWDRQEGKKAER